jgi:succinate-semialdehyde dehydrogenase/glutarate-semialdehyde dehydrogenase
MLFRAKDVNEAIEIANDTPFGLSASVWTREPAEQQRFISELQCGGVFLNAIVASDPRLPFGGIKRSGYGRELSAAGMREFLNAKTVVISAATATNEAVSKPYLVDTADPSLTR